MLKKKNTHNRKSLLRFYLAHLLFISIIAIILSTCCSATKEKTPSLWETQVLAIDKYGFTAINLTGDDLVSSGYAHGDIFAVKLGNSEFEAPLVTNLSDVDIASELLGDPGTPHNLLFAINMGDFAGKYNLNIGDTISIAIKEKGGYLESWKLRQMSRTYIREDYASDEIFANFREVTVGNIAPGRLYRNSHPVNPEFGRHTYANALAEKARVVTVVNLADSRERLEYYFAQEGFSSFFYKDLYDNGQVLCLDMGIDINSDSFKSKLNDGLIFITENDAPYMIHCNEGKDRAGFTLALIEALMGADIDEIVTDYMLSFVNYYHLVPGSQQYQAVAEGTIMKTLRIIAGIPVDANINDVDLQLAAEKYIVALGIDKSFISIIKSNLSH